MKKIERIRRQLEQRLRDLGAKVEEIEEDLRSPRSAGWEDRAIESESDEVMDALEESAVAAIKDIRAALKRIDAGTYGICARCGDRIDTARLEAQPYATQCIDCARAA